MELRARHQALLRNATDLAERGWPVFLLGASRRPYPNCPSCRDATDHAPAECPCLTCHGFYAATTDPDRIRRMVTAYPSGLLAVRTGLASGLAVIDIDPRNGGALDTALMPRTACVATGGGGWHLYYRITSPLASRPMPDRDGVDVKADGGYVVAPPSIHPGTGKPYRWVVDGPVLEMPPPLLAACQPVPVAPVSIATRPTPTASGRGISSPEALLRAHLDAVRLAPVGRRRATLYGASRGVARMVAAGAITPADAVAALHPVGQEAEQTEREIRAAITGGFRDEGVAA